MLGHFLLCIWAHSGQPVLLLLTCCPGVAIHLLQQALQSQPISWWLCATHCQEYQPLDICFRAPLSCNGALIARVVLAHFAPIVLNATAACGPVLDSCRPPVQMAVTHGSHSHSCCVINGAQVSIGSLVPLQLQSWVEAACAWAFLLYTRMLTLTGHWSLALPLQQAICCISQLAMALVKSHTCREMCVLVC